MYISRIQDRTGRISLKMYFYVTRNKGNYFLIKTTLTINILMLSRINKKWTIIY